MIAGSVLSVNVATAREIEWLGRGATTSIWKDPVAGRVRLEMLGNRYRLPRLDLRSGTARLTAAGAFTTERGNLDFQLAAPHLGEALPDTAGSLQARGTVAGPWTDAPA